MVKVAGIIGHNFSGSTLLSWILGSHPEIGALGETHHMMEGRNYESTMARYEGRKVGCYFHGEHCPIFPHDEIPYNAGDVHRVAADRMGVSIVSDESKLVDSFQRYEAARSADEYAYIVLFKEPDGFVHSFKKRHAGLESDRPVAILSQLYSGSYGMANRFAQGKPHLFLHYDALCSDVAGTMQKLGDLLEVDPAGFAPDRYWESDFHPSGGNTQVCVNKAPIELRRPWDNDPPEMDKLSKKVMGRAFEGLMLLADRGVQK